MQERPVGRTVLCPSIIIYSAWGSLLYHLGLLSLLSLAVFLHFPARLFIGNDGPTFIALATQQVEFFGVSPNLHTNFLSGIGNLSGNKRILPYPS